MPFFIFLPIAALPQRLSESYEFLEGWPDTRSAPFYEPLFVSELFSESYEVAESWPDTRSTPFYEPTFVTSVFEDSYEASEGWSV